jgi:putative ABC transport system permease protein
MPWEQAWNLRYAGSCECKIKFVSADHDFISTYGIKVVAGRGFSRDYSLDTSAFLINEALQEFSALKIMKMHRKDFGYGNRREN